MTDVVRPPQSTDLKQHVCTQESSVYLCLSLWHYHRVARSRRITAHKTPHPQAPFFHSPGHCGPLHSVPYSLATHYILHHEDVRAQSRTAELIFSEDSGAFVKSRPSPSTPYSSLKHPRWCVDGVVLPVGVDGVGVARAGVGVGVSDGSSPME